MNRRLLFVLAGCIAALPAVAQEGNFGGMYAYTSVDYDPDTNTATAYSETDLDSSLPAYYHPGVILSIVDQNGNYNYTWPQNCSYSTDNETYDAEECSWGGSPGYTYTATGEHWVEEIIIVSHPICISSPGDPCPPPPPTEYADEVDFGYYSSLGIDDPFGGQYTGFASGVDTTVEETVVARTYDSASVGPLATCYNADGTADPIRTALIKEYSIQLADFKPACTDFVSPQEFNAQGLFAFSYLTPDEGVPYSGNWALLWPYFNQGLAKVYRALGYPLNRLAPKVSAGAVNSGYRNPVAERAAAVNKSPYFANSRHMAGDAADLQTGGIAANYTSQRNAAKNPAVVGNPVACVEPHDKYYTHTHMDWRVSAPYGTYHYLYTGKSTCPNFW